MDPGQLRLSGLDKSEPTVEEGTRHARAEVLNKMKCSRRIVQYGVDEYFEVGKFRRLSLGFIKVI